MGWLNKSKRTPTSIPPTRQSIIGHRVLGHFELLQLIGEGSNGEVYLARPTEFADQQVVVKRIKPHLVANPRFRQFFDSEVVSMTRFNHPYVVQLFDASLDDPIGPCLVLEYVHGTTLEDLIQQYPRWHPRRIAKLVGQLCHALQAAHDAGIMHRDLKPANIMVTGFNTPNEGVKVMDFGFAGFTERPHIPMSELTDDGTVSALGTPAYVSPEMVRGDSVDHRADLYAVGVMLFEMFTGRLPFDYPTISQIVLAHAQQPPPRFSRLDVRDVSPAVEGVVQCALSKFASERHPTARELARHFGQAVGQEIWHETAPADQSTFCPGQQTLSMTIVDKTMVDIPAPGSLEDQFTFFDKFEAMLSPKLAAMKIKGFVAEVNGTVLDSQPGHVKMHLGLPPDWNGKPTRSGVIGWLTRRTQGVQRGEEPMEVNLQMQNTDANRVAVCVSFHPIKDFMPDDLAVWQERCEDIYNVLRMFLMAV
ncbi:serine/threonine protein kinase [Limnoglobus roseus]|uniref:Serine/threonine protein kinase n=1 Tax=Limnoglobus roseus TaxID=2598579 RepID=A0A5C1ALM5_9BACT|nr:serine/threonine-protein kinase [Limnoglobus roseus]QEL18074.1 serine/threonine protein kinase [Limnoglobus roseus]